MSPQDSTNAGPAPIRVPSRKSSSSSTSSRTCRWPCTRHGGLAAALKRGERITLLIWGAATITRPEGDAAGYLCDERPDENPHAHHQRIEDRGTKSDLERNDRE